MSLKTNKSPTNAKQVSKHTGRAPRADGDNTRQQIIETAGQLFADLGYGGTTSKLICEECGCNVAAVNYHFGSRDGLYSSVLIESHRRLIGFNTLMDIANGSDDSRSKLGRIIDTLIDGIDATQWHSRLFIREIMAPSVLIDEMIKTEALPKFAVLKSLLSDITGIDRDDPAMSRILISTMAPCMLLLVGNRDNLSKVLGNFLEDKEALKRHLKSFLFAGLDQLITERENITKNHA
jgi:AcrR family transcriptional regulator